jgi:hypothetical protein
MSGRVRFQSFDHAGDIGVLDVIAATRRCVVIDNSKSQFGMRDRFPTGGELRKRVMRPLMYQVAVHP